MATQYKYEAANANGTLKKVFESEKEAKAFAQEKLYDYPTYTITPVTGDAKEEKEKG
ncbi:MAG: hypothetical protein JWO03_3812 [Bacteroidetes bacterium]|nr:hypothetical protein [Bacteroidota bacterium]